MECYLQIWLDGGCEAVDLWPMKENGEEGLLSCDLSRDLVAQPPVAS